MRKLLVAVAAVALLGCGNSRAEREREYREKLSEYHECFFTGVVGVTTRDGVLTPKQRRELLAKAKEGQECVKPEKP